MADPVLQRVRRTQRLQDGLITRGQARAAGLTDRRIRLMLAREEWVAVHPGVYRRSDAELSGRARMRAAALSTGPETTLSGAAAAFWWSMTTVAPTPVEIVVPRHRHPRPRSGITVVRRDLDAVDVRTVDRVQVLDRPMAALRGAVALGRDGAQLLDRQLQNGLPIDLVRQAYSRQIGWHGAARARELLLVAGDGAAAESERIFVSLLRSAQISGWQLNAEVTINGRRYRPDVSFDRQRLAIEIDGWAWHSGPDRFRADRRRDRDFVLAGWRVLRFTWYDLIDRPNQVISEVRAAMTPS